MGGAAREGVWVEGGVFCEVLRNIRSPPASHSPPYGWIGFGWESDDRNWNDIFLLQAGEPMGLCSEAPPGVFSRPWTLGTASLDCNSWTASLPFAPL